MLRLTEIFNKRFSLLLAVLFVSFALSLSACGKTEEEPAKVSKRIKIELPDDMKGASSAQKKSDKPDTAAKLAAQRKQITEQSQKVADTEMAQKKKKPDVKWVNPRKASKQAKKKKKKTAAKKKSKKKATKKKTTKKKTKVTKKARVAGTSTYIISVSSFLEKNKAESLEKRLTDAGYNTYITEFHKGGKVWYRVRCGFYDGYSQATKIKNKLEKVYNMKGAWVTKPTSAEYRKYGK